MSTIDGRRVLLGNAKLMRALGAPLAALAAVSFADAQPSAAERANPGPNQGPNLGVPVSEADIASWDISIDPSGAGLPMGKGTAKTGEPVYQAGEEPQPEEVAGRVATYWKPYHEALAAELTRLRALHGRVVLWEGHSIRSVVPFLFEGRLPDFNLGTAAGASCSPALQQRLAGILEAQTGYTHIVNGRFKGGYITRQHGRPHEGVDAVQLELTQLNYMDEATFEFLPERAAPTRAVIRTLLQACL
jgi:N-formylglutamate deformylase